jgi:D-alanyl-lipoteichoic acid acyltransferase DltB (MBOAT superfamily)
MLFNSFEFLFFFPLVVLAYFASPQRWRWAVLLAASYWFYGAWRLEYLFLLMLTTTLDWAVAIPMSRAATQRRRKAWLMVSLTSNLGMLAYFKYAGFLHGTLQGLVEPLGIVLHDSPAFHPLLPVGISFYTFQTLAYSIDVYRGTVPPERHLGRFALYVSFFPQLVAGPIERAGKLQPQFQEVHRFHGGRVVSGLTKMGWGFFQKLVIADRLAPYVNEVFTGGQPQTAGSIILAAYFFYWQIYADFSGYTDIAIGSARVMGFELSENFDRAYLATSTADLWRRWHMSLMSWLRDYLARPLGFSRPGKVKWMRNIVIVFVVSGLWHGAAWTFALWGLTNAIFIIVGETSRRRRNRLWDRAAAALSRRNPRAGALLPTARVWMQRVFMFNLMAIPLIWFRAPSFGRALEMYGTVLRAPGTLFSLPGWPLPPYELLLAVAAVVLFMIVDGGGRALRWPERFAVQPRWVRWSAAYAVCLVVLMFGEFALVPFYYFQF